MNTPPHHSQKKTAPAQKKKRHIKRSVLVEIPKLPFPKDLKKTKKSTNCGTKRKIGMCNFISKCSGTKAKRRKIAEFTFVEQMRNMSVS